eukprot:COSAG06_NODE_21976_length_738_cov_4.228482_1_plen_81_part_10
MACCAAPKRRRGRRSPHAERGSPRPATEEAYGVLLKTISDATEAGSEGALSPVQLEVQRDLRLDLHSPGRRRPRSPPSLPR